MTRTARPLARVAALGATVAAALILAGCAGSPASAPGDAGPTFNPKQKVTLHISWWGNDGRAALMSKAIDLFEKKYPNVTVKAESVGAPDDLFNRLTTDFAAGGTTAPDVFALGGALPQQYGASGQLLDLGTVSKYVDIKDYPKTATVSATVKGKLYGLPTGGNAIGVLVNEDLFQKAGVDLPKSDWTWDDFVTAANEIGKSDAGVAGVDLRIQDILGTYIAQLNKTGVYNFKGKVAATPKQIQSWLEIEQRLVKGGGMPDPSVVVENHNLTPDQTLFGTGKAAMTFTYSNQIAAYSQGTNGAKVEIVAPPTSTKLSGLSVLPSQFWAINAHTAHPAASALLVDWLLNQPQAAKVILADRGLPFNPNTLKVVQPLLAPADAEAAAYLQKVLKVGLEAPPQPNGGSVMNDLSQRIESDVLFGKTSAADGGTSFVQQLTAALATAQ